MNREWEAWRAFCVEFEKLTRRDINGDDCTPMVKAVRLWGEELHALRLTAPEHDERALAEARKAVSP
jgi:hypothetical protein